MNHSVKTKVTLFIVMAMLAISGINSWIFISAQKKSIAREVTARAIALSEALSRSVDEGLAMENLNLIRSVEETVHTNDVLFTQVYSILWLGVAAVPDDRLNVPPDPAAVAHFKKHRNENTHFVAAGESWIDVYHSVLYDPHDQRLRKIPIGFVRLRVSTDAVQQAIRDAVVLGIFVAALLALLSVIVLNAIINRQVLKPVLALHTAARQHREGAYPAVPVYARDEIGELSAEFNAMSAALREREERLAEEKERLAVTLRSIGDSVIVTDTRGTITLLNRVAEEQTGWTAGEAVGMPLADVFHIVSEKTGERCRNPFEKVIETGITCGLANHTALIRRDGSRIVIEDSAAPIRDKNSRIVGVVLVFRDVTEKRRMEEEFIKAEKLQSVGLLAGGLAHDFNNLLTSIVGNISIARMYIDGRSRAQARLSEAETASRRATDLTYQLLTFSRGGTPVRKSASIGEIIRESAGFALSGASVAAEFNMAPDCRNVDVDAGQMSQVFNNLIINAVQAMPSGGTIRFDVENCVLDEDEVPTLPPGRYVRITVRDTGSGIPAEHLPRIFDPYFTTKQKGSGLGLASVYSIIKRHEGHITVESEPGRGTVFRIHLPASAGTPESAGPDESAVPGGRGRVLIMDDEKIVREVAGEMLRALGYEPDFALNGAEALERYREAMNGQTPYAAVIMDLTVPAGMGGRETIEKLRELDPGVTAIVSSGYSNDPVMAEYERHGFKAVITKPYDIGNLGRTLREVLR